MNCYWTFLSTTALLINAIWFISWPYLYLIYCFAYTPCVYLNPLIVITSIFILIDTSFICAICLVKAFQLSSTYSNISNWQLSAKIKHIIYMLPIFITYFSIILFIYLIALTTICPTIWKEVQIHCNIVIWIIAVSVNINPTTFYTPWRLILAFQYITIILI